MRTAPIRTLADRGFAPAAFFIDSALTSSGIFDPPPAWAAAVTARVRAAGGLIVADEVQYGLGRSGSHFWGFARRGIEPDIVTLGKAGGQRLSDGRGDRKSRVDRGIPGEIRLLFHLRRQSPWQQPRGLRCSRCSIASSSCPMRAAPASICACDLSRLAARHRVPGSGARRRPAARAARCIGGGAQPARQRAKRDHQYSGIRGAGADRLRRARGRRAEAAAADAVSVPSTPTCWSRRSMPRRRGSRPPPLLSAAEHCASRGHDERGHRAGSGH